jgi:ketosteroid isomerase-like protein
MLSARGRSKLLFCGLTWLAGCAHSPGTPPPPSTASVLVQRLTAAMAARDLPAMMSCVSPDYESFQPFHPERHFKGRQHMQDTWSGIFGSVTAFDPGVQRTVPTGDEVWMEWHWHAVRGDGTQWGMSGIAIFHVTGDQIDTGRLYMEPDPSAPK